MRIHEALEISAKIRLNNWKVRDYVFYEKGQWVYKNSIGLLSAFSMSPFDLREDRWEPYPPRESDDKNSTLG